MIITSLLGTLLGGLIGAGIGAGAAAAIEFFIDSLSENDVRAQLQKDGALYGLIKEKQENVLTVDEIDKMGDTMNRIEFKTNSMSDTFYIGQKIFAYI